MGLVTFIVVYALSLWFWWRPESNGDWHPIAAAMAVAFVVAVLAMWTCEKLQ